MYLRRRLFLNEAAARVQSIARGLSPVRVDALTAEQALHRVAKDASATLDLDVDVDVDPPAGSQPAQTTEQLCLIAQEAVRNAWRHGRASRVQISLKSRGGVFTLSIEDDGVGMPAEDPTPGVGLESMRTRAQALGGSLLVTSAASGGALVRCTWSEGCASSDRSVRT